MNFQLSILTCKWWSTCQTFLIFSSRKLSKPGVEIQGGHWGFNKYRPNYLKYRPHSIISTKYRPQKFLIKKKSIVYCDNITEIKLGSMMPHDASWVEVHLLRGTMLHLVFKRLSLCFILLCYFNWDKCKYV